jgi:hypothetical protein
MTRLRIYTVSRPHGTDLRGLNWESRVDLIVEAGGRSPGRSRLAWIR